MSKQTGTIVTVVVALITLCCSLFICLFGAMIAFGGGEWAVDFGVPYEGQIEPAYGYPVICLGFLIWIIPVLVGVLVARRSRNEA
jgi:hypothetical protein